MMKPKKASIYYIVPSCGFKDTDAFGISGIIHSHQASLASERCTLCYDLDNPDCRRIDVEYVGKVWR